MSENICHMTCQKLRQNNVTVGIAWRKVHFYIYAQRFMGAKPAVSHLESSAGDSCQSLLKFFVQLFLRQCHRRRRRCARFRLRSRATSWRRGSCLPQGWYGMVFGIWAEYILIRGTGVIWYRYVFSHVLNKQGGAPISVYKPSLTTNIPTIGYTVV